MAGDEYMVIGSDGLWDVLQQKLVVFVENEQKVQIALVMN